MWSHEVKDGILQIEMTPEVVILLRMRERLAYQTPVALARGQVITFDIRGVDLLTLKDAQDRLFFANQDSALYFHDSAVLAPLIYLRVE